MRERGGAGVGVWLTVLPPGVACSFDDLARAAGIEPLGRAWIEIDYDDARSLLAGLLHKDLAYSAELMPKHRADWLTLQFLQAFGGFGNRYATNTEPLSSSGSRAWNPATEFTFDAGVVVIGEEGAGLYWVADED